MTTKTNTEGKAASVETLREATKVLFGTVNVIAAKKVLCYLENLGNTKGDYTTIDSALAEVSGHGAERSILTELLKAMSESNWDALDVAQKIQVESRPQQDESQPETATVTTTPNSTSRPTKSQLMEQTMRQMQELMSGSDEDSQGIAVQVFNEKFKPAFVDALEDKEGRLGIEKRVQAIVDSTPPKMDDEKVKLAVDAVIQGAFGVQAKKDLSAGDKVLLPPIQSPCPYFVRTPIVDEIDYSYEMGQPIIIDGPSGAGKTYVIEQMLRAKGKRYLKINFADGMRLSDLTARQEIVVENGQTKTVYVDGLLTFAMRHGLPLICDEADQAPQEMMSVLNPTMDKFPGELLLPSGERVVSKPGFWVALTGNTLTDETGLYSGYKPSNALTNRCSSIKSTYLDKMDEIRILEKDGLNPGEARVIVNVMTVLRDMYLNKGSVSQAPSTRQAVRISRYIQGKDVYGKDNPNLPGLERNRAWHLAFFNFLPKSEYENAVNESRREDSTIEKI